MRMKDFLSLQELRPHNDLVKEGLVVPLDDAKAKGEIINFISRKFAYLGPALSAWLLLPCGCVLRSPAHFFRNPCH